MTLTSTTRDGSVSPINGGFFSSPGSALGSIIGGPTSACSAHCHYSACPSQMSSAMGTLPRAANGGVRVFPKCSICDLGPNGSHSQHQAMPMNRMMMTLGRPPRFEHLGGINGGIHGGTTGLTGFGPLMGFGGIGVGANGVAAAPAVNGDAGGIGASASRPGSPVSPRLSAEF